MLIEDDPLSYKELTEKQRDAVLAWFHTPLPEKYTSRVWVLGTKFHKDDLFKEYLDRSEQEGDKTE